MNISLHITVLIVRGCFDRTHGLNKLFLHLMRALLMFNYDKPSRIFPCILLTRNHMIFLVQFGKLHSKSCDYQYKHNRPLLKIKGDFFKEWYNGFHNPRKEVVKRVGDRAQGEKMRWTVTETDIGRNFLFTKFSVDFFLSERRIFSCTRQK